MTEPSSSAAAPAAQRRMTHRAPVEVDHKRAPKPSEFEWALACVASFGEQFLDALKEATGEHIGRPGSVTTHGVLVAWFLLVTENGHKAEITDVVSQLLALNEDQLAQLDMKPLPVSRAYKRFHDKFTKVRRALEEGFTYTDAAGQAVEVTLDWWTSTTPRQAIPSDLASSKTRSVDGTDWESPGRFRAAAQPEYDGDAPVDTDDDLDEHAQKITKARGRTKRKNVWEIGPDGRAIHTTDRDARAGYRTTTDGRKGGFYIGSEIHLSVQARDFQWQGDVTRVSEGPEVPGFVTGAVLAPAGTHRANAAVPMLLREKGNITTVVWDRGYSILPFANAHGRLLAEGIQAVFDLSSTQRAHPAVSEKVIWIDGHPFHEHTPKELRDLPRLPMNATEEQRAEYEKAFNARAAWRWNRLAGPDADGVTRWQCPFHAGRLRCRNFRQKKTKKSAQLVDLPAAVKKCCEGTLQVSAEYNNLVQACAIPYGTTAHGRAYARRNLVETGNSYFGGTYIDLERTYSRLMGNTNRKFVLAIMLAGLNRYIERSWRAKQEVIAKAARAVAQRAKRRKNTLQEILGGSTVSTPSVARVTRRNAAQAPLRT